jgi:hypothetical protein
MAIYLAIGLAAFIAAVIRLVDPAAQGPRAGLGTCTRDPGSPTGVTLLTLYRNWIARTARRWGSTLATP